MHVKKTLYKFTLFCILALLYVDTPTVKADDIFPPFYSREQKEFNGVVIEKISFRPFFTVYRTLTEDKKFTFEQLQLLWPFFFYQKTDEKRFFRFFPLVYSTDKFQEYGTDSDHFIFPFLAWGNDPKEGAYFMFLPFGGVDKGHLAKEKITVVMFPLYLKTEYKGFVSKNYLFPFVQTNRGNKHDGWRVWPFYGTYKIFKDDQNTQLTEERNFAFWPFWIEQNRYYEGNLIGHSFISFPFYGKYTSNSKKDLMVLWPLYKRVEYPKENGKFHTILWPILKFGKSQTKKHYELFPLYGYKKNEQLTSQFFLWPLIRHEKQDDSLTKSSRFWFLPIWWNHYYYDKDKETYRRKKKLWPLFQYNKEADGKRKIEILSPFWFKDSAKGGFENNYADFFRLFHTQYYKKDSYHTKLLFNLIQFQKDKENRKIKIFPFIYKYEKSPQKKKVSFLGGLIEYRRNEKQTGFSFLWIPFNRYKK